MCGQWSMENGLVTLGIMSPNDAPSPPAGDAAPRPHPSAEGQGARPEPYTFELDGQLAKLEEALAHLRAELGYWAKRGVTTRVRFKFAGKQLLPDLPVAAFLAAEAATFWWSGLLRTLVVNLGGRALLQVEFISDAEPHLAQGKEALLQGELDEAKACFQRALEIDRDLPAAHLNLGVCHRLAGERDAALQRFERALALDPGGEHGRAARAHIEKLGGAPNQP